MFYIAAGRLGVLNGQHLMLQLRELCNCSSGETSRLGVVRTILGTDIERYGDALLTMLASSDQASLGLYGCFAARRMLEAGCIGILSTIDPARLLVLREFQLRSDYALGERHPAAIDWRTDVVSERAAKWADGVAPDKFIRSLLGGHVAEIMWSHAIGRLENLDRGIASSSFWIEELTAQLADRRANLPQDANANAAELAVLASFRTVAQQTFSALSKGVHLEFIVEQSRLFDPATIVETIGRAIKTLAQISFVSNLMDCAHRNIDIARAAALVKEIEDRINATN